MQTVLCSYHVKLGDFTGGNLRRLGNRGRRYWHRQLGLSPAVRKSADAKKRAIASRPSRHQNGLSSVHIL